MSLKVVSVGSSSSGNSYIIRADGHVIILDVGLTARSICEALAELGIEPDEVSAVLVTHEHIDHVRSVRAISRMCRNAVFYASRGTIGKTPNFSYVPDERVFTVAAGEMVDLEGFTFSTFPLSHDAAEPLGFTVEAGGEKLAVVTDTGIVTDEIYEAIRDADMLVFESNHDSDMLMFGEYPYHVKVRIKGDNGHLSNDYAAEVLARILEERKESAAAASSESGSEKTAGSAAERPLRIMLAHLSFHNNIPLFARQTVEDALFAAGFRKGNDYLLEVAAREGLTMMGDIESGKQ